MFTAYVTTCLKTLILVLARWRHVLPRMGSSNKKIWSEGSIMRSSVTHGAHQSLSDIGPDVNSGGFGIRTSDHYDSLYNMK